MSETGQPPSRLVEYAGFWKRFLAAVIDLLIVLVIVVPLELALFGTDYPELAMRGETLAEDFWIQIVLFIALILFWRFAGGTPGLMAISAKIVDQGNFSRVPAARLVFRAVLLALMLIIVPLGIGLLWIGFDRRKQGWHDKLAKTVVIYDD